MTGLTLSVVLPNFNHGHLLAEALDAILMQSRPADEIIVVDDGSTDDSVDVVRRFERSNSSVRLLRNDRNQGTYAAVARGRREASGAFIYFAAADDRTIDGLFQQSIALLTENPSAAFCSALTRTMDLDGSDAGIMPTPRVLDRAGYISPQRALRLLWEHGGWFRCNTALYRRNLLEAEGGFNPSLGTFADGFACMILSGRHGCCFIPEALASVRSYGDSISAKTMRTPEEAIRVFGEARRLIESGYADLFSKKFVRRWDGRWRYAVAKSLIDAEGKSAWPRMPSLLPDPRGLDNLAFRMFERLPGIRRLLGPAYLAARLVPWDVPGAVSAGLRSRLRISAA